MAYTWSNDLVTGNAAIDAQHKQLVTAVNSLLEACTGGKGRAALISTLEFLISYTLKHFADEEKIQLQCKYPDYENHKKIHESFKVTVSELAKQLHDEGPTVSLVAKVNSNLGKWLVSHIQREDMKIAAHMRKIGWSQAG